LARQDIQYHWHNRDYYTSFEDFLSALKHKKRKNIRQERRQVADSGINCSMQPAAHLSTDDLHQVHALYQNTFDEKGNHAALTAPFFAHLAETFGERMLVALARRDGVILAMALFLAGPDTLYGRYWGTSQDIPGLHFELCYYQGIEYAIAHGLERFEPGAQGRHKMARGFLPARTHSRHYLDHPGLRSAVAVALAHEAEDIEAYHQELLTHSPYTVR
jgi:predicted N-acyltransferase